MQVTSPLKEGDIVADSYAVDRVIGAGGMAIVALASHVEYRHRVAIKILRPENSRKQDVVKRFEREQRTLTMLHSEHTLRIYGFGQHAGLPYMLIEYLEGQDLAELIKAEGPPPIERAVGFILQACHALAEAHLLGVVHRDLKPGNLFLTRRTDGSPCIKVLDFGISKVNHERTGVSEPSLVTKTAAVMGSPFYMSPEQMLSSANVDARSDIWSLGVTLYELLTKTLPFAADSAAAVCGRIMSDEPTPLRKLRPNYPQQLEQVIARCLQRRPEARFPTIADLATRLAEFGPAHGEHAVKAICELIQPVAPVVDDEPTATVEGPVSASATLNDTTVYLPNDPTHPGTWPRTGALLGTAAIAFGLGVGVGWVLNLDTDPTGTGVHAAAATPAARSTSLATAIEPGPPRAASAVQPTASADPSMAQPIDLDRDAKDRGPDQAASPQPRPSATTRLDEPPSRRAPKVQPMPTSAPDAPRPLGSISF